MSKKELYTEIKELLESDDKLFIDTVERLYKPHDSRIAKYIMYSNACIGEYFENATDVIELIIPEEYNKDDKYFMLTDKGIMGLNNKRIYRNIYKSDDLIEDLIQNCMYTCDKYANDILDEIFN